MNKFPIFMEQIIFQKELKELEMEAYGERAHGGKSMPSNVYFFKKQFLALFQMLYSCCDNDNLALLYDYERDIEGKLNYLIERKITGKQLSDNLIEILSQILSATSIVSNGNN